MTDHRKLEVPKSLRLPPKAMFKSLRKRSFLLGIDSSRARTYFDTEIRLVENFTRSK